MPPIGKNLEETTKEAYEAYGTVTDFKNYQGLPMPKWEDLTPQIKKAWQAAVDHVSGLVLQEETQRAKNALEPREIAQVAHAKEYEANHAAAGVPGHGQFMLIAKLARILGL